MGMVDDKRAREIAAEVHEMVTQAYEDAKRQGEAMDAAIERRLREQ